MAEGFQASPSTRPDIFSGEQQRLLGDNLDPRHVKTLRGNGYIEGWHAIAEANRIFGFGAWDVELRRLEKTNADLVDVTEGRTTKKQWRVGYIATVRVIVHGEGGSRFKDGTGYGSGYGKDNQLGEAIESASKEAETDAFKRAMRNFGNQFGLALYDKKRANVGPSTLTDADEDQDPDAGEHETPEPGGVAGGGASPASPPAQAQTPLTKKDARADYSAMQEEIRNCRTVRELGQWGQLHAKRAGLLPNDWKAQINAQYAEMMKGLKQIEKEAADYAAKTAREADEEFEQRMTP